MDINLLEYAYYIDELKKSAEEGNALAELFFMDKLDDIWYGASLDERAALDKIATEKAAFEVKGEASEGKEFRLKI